MPSLRVIDENGEMQIVDVSTEGMTIEIGDRGSFNPAVVHRLEYDSEGGMSHVSWKNCDRFENRCESDKGPDITAEGIVTQDQLEPLKTLDGRDDLTLTSDLYSGTIAVKRVTIEQTNDLVEVVPEGEEPQLAFGFQLQIKESQHYDSVATVDLSDTVYAETADAALDDE